MFYLRWHRRPTTSLCRTTLHSERNHVATQTSTLSELFSRASGYAQAVYTIFPVVYLAYELTHLEEGFLKIPSKRGLRNSMILFFYYYYYYYIRRFRFCLLFYPFTSLITYILYLHFLTNHNVQIVIYHSCY